MLGVSIFLTLVAWLLEKQGFPWWIASILSTLSSVLCPCSTFFQIKYSTNNNNNTYTSQLEYVLLHSCQSSYIFQWLFDYWAVTRGSVKITIVPSFQSILCSGSIVCQTKIDVITKPTIDSLISVCFATSSCWAIYCQVLGKSSPVDGYFIGYIIIFCYLVLSVIPKIRYLTN